MQRQNLRHINPRNTIRRRAKDQHVQEEESNGSRCSLHSRVVRVLIGLVFEAEEDGNHHHADGEAEGTPHHGFSATHAVEEECWDEGAEEEPGIDGVSVCWGWV